MIRTWNFGTFEDLQPEVLIQGTRTLGGTRTRFSVRKVVQAVAVGTAVFTSTLLFKPALTNKETAIVRLPDDAVVRIPPPLEGVFANRFGAHLTSAEEKALVTIIENAPPPTRADLRFSAIEFLFANQEDEFGAHPRVSRQKVERLVKSRKIV